MSVRHVDVKEAHRLQTEERYTYVDVRSIPEYDQGHPSDACNVPLLHHDQQAGRMIPNPEFVSVMEANYSRDAMLLIGCQVGGRSVKAAQLLVSMGYQNVANVLGGFGGSRDPVTGQIMDKGWSMSGLPVEGTTQPGASYGELLKKVP